MESHTIAAISTSPGKAAISVVRVSGPDALTIADRVFEGHPPLPSQRPGGSFVHGFVTAGNGDDADEVILLIYRAPHSYTREDVVEFQGHGGRFAAQRILRVLTLAGARPAEPGEFTQRAFLSGRIDLVQAEAVMDLIAAQSDRAARAAVDQLEGCLSGVLETIYSDCISTSSCVSALLDFSEDDIVAGLSPSIGDRVASVRVRIQAVLDTWREGRVLREGVRVVICGRPNTGKSTLMNALLSSRRAIVTDVPGTTRDTIEEGLEIEGIPIRLVDTAGIREAACKIEREGVERTREVMNRADIILYVVDASQALADCDSDQLASLAKERTIVVLNKADLGTVLNEPELHGHASVTCSLINGTGLNRVRSAIVTRIGVSADADSHIAISQRHRSLLEIANRDLELAQAELNAGFEHLAQAAMFLRAASIGIGEILGKTYTSDLLNSVFSRFCIGK